MQITESLTSPASHTRSKSAATEIGHKAAGIFYDMSIYFITLPPIKVSVFLSVEGTNPLKEDWSQIAGPQPFLSPTK